jgi:hypothetical protein
MTSLMLATLLVTTALLPTEADTQKGPAALLKGSGAEKRSVEIMRAR